ncbi:RSP_7527 family protein [Loktanella sp. DJP18]
MDYTYPTPEQIDASIRAAHRMRSEMIASLIRSLFRRKTEKVSQPAEQLA